HEIFLQLLEGEFHKAPLRNPHRILDVGTGTGIWAIDMADTYPAAEVIGTDLSPIQPTWVPANCKFEVDDAEMEWTFQPDYFDFIHLRNLAQGISNWSHVMSEVYRSLLTRSQVELVEVGLGELLSDDGSLADDNHAKRVVDLVAEAMKRIGRPSPTVARMKQYLQDAGFVDITVSSYKQPFGPWPKDKRLKQAGSMALMMLQTGIEAYSMAAFTRILGIPQEEAAQLCRDAYQAMRYKHLHTYNFL
ncbi:S-adenosyl-L-methionine-dependent methyltransferase, partial [Sphaerosporella brunnea]